MKKEPPVMKMRNENVNKWDFTGREKNFQKWTLEKVLESLILVSKGVDKDNARNNLPAAKTGRR